MKNIIKYLGLAILVFLSVASAFAEITPDDNNNRAYYTLDNTLNDATGRTGSLTNNGATYTASGKINGAYDFENTNSEYMTAPSQLLPTNSDFTLNFWINLETSTNNNLFAQWSSGSASNRVLLYTSSSSYLVLQRESTAILSTNPHALNAGVWYMVTLTRDGSDYELYLNGVLNKTGTNAGDLESVATIIGKQGGVGAYSDGIFDEISIWNKSLTSDDIDTLYNAGVGCQYGYSDCLSSPATILTNLTDSSFYSNTPISVSLNTSNINTNMSYSLNGASFTSICANCNITTESISFIENQNNISFKANTSGTSIYTNYTIYIDTGSPIVTVDAYTEYNDTYTFNTSLLNGNCTDLNLDTCIFYWDDATSTNNGADKTFSTSGNHTFTLNATDLAGNVASASGTIFINPAQYFYFEDENSNSLSSFEIDGVEYNNYYSFELYDFSLGSNSVEFSANGYQTQTINFVTNNTTELNQTFTVSTARILLYIRDQDTGDIISGTNFSTEFVATVGYSATTTTGLINVSNTLFQNEEYLVVISNDAYQTESIYFDFSNQEVLTINAYMINSSDSNLGNIFVKPVDSFGNPIVGATVKALQWSSSDSAYLEVSQSKSGSDGLGTLNIILNDKVYIFSAEYLGVVANSTAEIIDTTENGKTVTILLSSQRQEYNYLFENLYTNVVESFNNVTNISTISFTWNDNTGVSRDICINSYRKIKSSETRLTTNCTSGVSGVYTLNFNINNSYTTLIKGEILLDSAYYPVATFTYLPQNNVPDLFESLGLAIFIVPLLFLGAISLAMLIENTTVGTFVLMLTSGLSLLIAPTILNGSIVAFLFFMGWLTINYGVKQR